jgi:hypothetical protein
MTDGCAAGVVAEAMRMASLRAGESIANGMQFLIFSSGRARARELIQLNRYAGPAPVPVEAYTAVTEHQAASHLRTSASTAGRCGPPSIAWCCPTTCSAASVPPSTPARRSSCTDPPATARPGAQALLTPATIDLACASYFVHAAEGW